MFNCHNNHDHAMGTNGRGVMKPVVNFNHLMLFSKKAKMIMCKWGMK
jgi:hypothetical protein